MSQRKNKKNGNNRRRGVQPDGGGSGGSTKHQAAESLVQRAMGEEDSSRRARLARRALTLDESCADAWGILGEAEEDDPQAVRLFREAYRLAEASLGEPARRAIRNEGRGDPAVDVRGDPAGLTYLRARAALGFRLIFLATGDTAGDSGQRAEEATDHLVGVLRLDPEDDFGLTHPALSFWLEQDDPECLKAANTILSTHPCDCAQHMFSRTLVYYRRFGGEDYRTRYALAEAIASGPLIPMFLYGELPMPADLPSLEEMQQAGYTDALDEGGRALILSAGSAREMLGGWERTPGAGGWLKEMYALISRGLEEYFEDPGISPSGVSGSAGSSQSNKSKKSKSAKLSAASEAHGALEGAGVEGLARVLGVPESYHPMIEVTDPPAAWHESRYPGTAYRPYSESSSSGGSGASGVSSDSSYSSGSESETGQAGDNPRPEAGDLQDWEDWGKARAGFLFWREREEEDPVLSRFKDSLRELIEDRARKAGLEPESGTAPFPNSLSPVAALLGEPEGASPLAYLAIYGTAGQVAELADELLTQRIADFTLITDDPQAAGELRELGAEVFEGPMNDK